MHCHVSLKWFNNKGDSFWDKHDRFGSLTTETGILAGVCACMCVHVCVCVCYLLLMGVNLVKLNQKIICNIIVTMHINFSCTLACYRFELG